MAISSVSSWLPIAQYGISGCLGYKATARIINKIASRYPFLKETETPLCIVGSVCFMAVVQISSAAAFVSACIAYAMIAIYVNYTKGHTYEGGYSPEVFKWLFLSGREFPPGPIMVTGTLDLSGCTNFTTLPENLHVKGDLILRGCTNLRELPLFMGLDGNLDLHGCRRIRYLPGWIFNLGGRSDGSTRQVWLTGLIFEQAVLDQFSLMNTLGDLFFHLPPQGVQHRPPQDPRFATLEKALTFWKNESQYIGRALPEMELMGDALRFTLEFLQQLTETAEYKNADVRPVLANRVIEAFELMAGNEEIRDLATEIIRFGLTSCDDRIISALDEIDLMVRIHDIEKLGLSGEKELRKLGRGLCCLEMIDKKVYEHMRAFSDADEVSVSLVLRIGLKERFDLPLSTQNMIFIDRAMMTDVQIQAAGNAIDRECTEAKVSEFLAKWDPWKKFQRRLAVRSYNDLPTGHRQPGHGNECGILLLVAENPVLYGNRIYDYDAFVNHYINKGTHPETIQPLEWNRLQRPV